MWWASWVQEYSFKRGLGSRVKKFQLVSMMVIVHSWWFQDEVKRRENNMPTYEDDDNHIYMYMYIYIYRNDYACTVLSYVLCAICKSGNVSLYGWLLFLLEFPTITRILQSWITHPVHAAGSAQTWCGGPDLTIGWIPSPNVMTYVGHIPDGLGYHYFWLTTMLKVEIPTQKQVVGNEFPKLLPPKNVGHDPKDFVGHDTWRNFWTTTPPKAFVGHDTWRNCWTLTPRNLDKTFNNFVGKDGNLDVNSWNYGWLNYHVGPEIFGKLIVEVRCSYD